MADVVYRVQGPDGKVYRIRGPEGASHEEIGSAAEEHFAGLERDKKFDESVKNSASEGLKDDLVKGGMKAGAVGAGMLTSAGLGWLFRRAFPGVTPTRSFLREMDEALGKDFGKTMNVKSAFPRYMKDAVESGKPITFADWLAQKSGAAQGETFAPNTMSAINRVLDSSGKGAEVRKGLVDRIAGTKSRALDDLAQGLGVPKTTLAMTQDEIEKQAQAKAKPLYEAAFKDKSPLRDTRLLDFMMKHEDLMSAALDHADEAFKFDPSKQVESQMGVALAGNRKDRWKWNTSIDDVPEFLRLGEPRNGLQRHIAPNLETYDRMKRALWALAQKRAKDGAGDVGAIHGARRELVDLLDQLGPAEYKQARQAWRGSEEMQDAFEMGQGLLKQNPADVRKALLSMTPEQRMNLSRGFYGSLEGQDSQKFIREIVANPEKYEQEREILSSVFPDTQKLEQFLDELGGENAMVAGTVGYRRGAPLPPSKNLLQGLAGRIYGGAGYPHAYLRENVPLDTGRALGKPRVASRGTSIMFDEPDINGPAASHPWWQDIQEHKRVYPGDYGWMGAGAGAGALAASAAGSRGAGPLSTVSVVDPENEVGAGALGTIQPYMQ